MLIRHSLPLDFTILVVTVLTGVSFNTPEFGLGSNERLVRVALQAFTVGAAAVAVWRCERGPIAELPTATKVLFAFCGLAAASTLWSVDVFRTLSQSLAAFATVVLIVVHSRSTHWHRTRRLLLAGFSAVLLASLVVEALLSTDGLFDARWSGIAGSPTQLAQLATISGALALVGWLRNHQTTEVTVAIVALCVALIVVSQSRVALATLIALTAAVAWLSTPKAARMYSAIAVVATSVALTFIALPVLSRLALRDSAEVGDLASLTGRTSIWPLALERIAEQPLIGYGFASGEVLWAQQVMVGNSNWNATNSHQIFLETMLSLGVVGLILFVGVIGALLSQPQSGRRAPALLLTATILALGATESMLHFNAPTIPVLGLAAMGAYSNAQRVSDGSPAVLIDGKI